MDERTVGATGRWTLAMVPAIALIVVAVAGLWHLRHSAIEAQQRELTLLSVALTDEIDRGLQDAQQGLQAMKLELQEDRLPVSGAQAAHDLQTSAYLMPLVDQLWLIDSEGRVMSASRPSTPPAIASFSPALDRLGDDSIAISSPFTDAGSNETSIAVAMPFSDSSARTGRGWIIAALPARDLLGAFSVASPATDARMAVFRSDGVR